MFYKKCKACKQSKIFTAFNKEKGGLLGRKARCKECVKNRYRENPDNIRTQNRDYKHRLKARDVDKYCQTVRNDRLRLRYNMTHTDYLLMFSKQSGLCAICGKPETLKTPNNRCKNLSVDHNHSTGAVRGLLCVNCNRRLGVLEDEQFVKLAMDYLNCSKTDDYTKLT